VAELLIRAGTNGRTRCQYGYTVLHIAAMVGGRDFVQILVAPFLVDASRSIEFYENETFAPQMLNDLDNQGRTPLMLAVNIVVEKR
jgi:ankyrin repeat protein